MRRRIRAVYLLDYWNYVRTCYRIFRELELEHSQVELIKLLLHNSRCVYWRVAFTKSITIKHGCTFMLMFDGVVG